MRRILFLTAAAMAALLANDVCAVRLESMVDTQLGALEDKPATPAAPDAKKDAPKKEEEKKEAPKKDAAPPAKDAKPADAAKDKDKKA